MIQRNVAELNLGDCKAKIKMLVSDCPLEWLGGDAEFLVVALYIKHSHFACNSESFSLPKTPLLVSG